MLKIHTLRALKDNFIYAVEGSDQQCAIIDPGDAGPVQEFLRTRNLRLTHILCTHHHWDHVNGIADLGAPVVVASEFDQARIPGCTLTVSEARPLKLWGQPVQILETPGHTLGQIAYHFAAEHALFSGDTLFSAGCGRLFEGTMEQMFESMKKLRTLPPHTRIYFGHEYTLRNLDFILSRAPDTNLAAYRAQIAERVRQGHDTSPSPLATELEFNPFLNARTVAEFTDWRQARDHW